MALIARQKGNWENIYMFEFLLGIFTPTSDKRSIHEVSKLELFFLGIVIVAFCFGVMYFGIKGLP